MHRLGHRPQPTICSNNYAISKSMHLYVDEEYASNDETTAVHRSGRKERARYVTGTINQTQATSDKQRVTP